MPNQLQVNTRKRRRITADDLLDALKGNITLPHTHDADTFQDFQRIIEDTVCCNRRQKVYTAFFTLCSTERQGPIAQRHDQLFQLFGILFRLYTVAACQIIQDNYRTGWPISAPMTSS